MLASHEALPALISAAEQALALASNFEEIKAIRDRADALRALAKKLSVDTKRLDTIKVRAERVIGQQLRQYPKAKGAKGNPGGRGAKIVRSAAGTAQLTLCDLGITKKQSAQWQKLADIPEDKFIAYLANAEEVSTAGAIKFHEPEAKKTKRGEREQDLAEQTRAAAAQLGIKLYGVIYADPPWRFEPYSRETGIDRAAENHYPTMSVDDIAAIQVPAAKNCVLSLWATAPKLPEALRVMTAWGFTYKTEWIWRKSRLGTGFWLRNQHESLLIGVKGGVPAPAPGQQPPSVIEADVGRHSEKPARFAEMIEEMFLTLPRLEMFARAPRPGWDVWGNEA
jgi:N6-adenosine-specific RNA methylase IME4